MQVNIAKKERLHEVGYRYKRDVIRVQHEKFNGNVTRITNLAAIARQLQMTPENLQDGFVKQVKKKLGIPMCGPLTFPGTRSASELDLVLQELIEAYILCPRCVLPEWNGKRCDACGHTKKKQ